MLRVIAFDLFIYYHLLLGHAWFYGFDYYCAVMSIVLYGNFNAPFNLNQTLRTKLLHIEKFTWPQLLFVYFSPNEHCEPVLCR